MSCPQNSSDVLNTFNSSYVGYNSNVSNNVTITNDNRAQYNNNLTQSNSINKQSNCRKIVSKYPSFTPTLSSLSVTSSVQGVYSLVYVSGTNFLPTCIGTTYVNFGPFTQLPITYFSSASLSFVVPLNAKVGEYKVVVVNVYNGNFSPQVNITYAGNLNFSNALLYTIV